MPVVLENREEPRRQRGQLVARSVYTVCEPVGLREL